MESQPKQLPVRLKAGSDKAEPLRMAIGLIGQRRS